LPLIVRSCEFIAEKIEFGYVILRELATEESP